MSQTILNIQEKIEVDDAIKSYEYVEYQPITGSQLNTSGQITITIENTDDFYYPRGSWLLAQGQLVKGDGTPYADADDITLTNNAIMYLFTNIKYSLGDAEIESLNHPGFATTMLGSIKYSENYRVGPALMRCWLPDTSQSYEDANTGCTMRHAYIIKNPDPKGSFSFAIPLEHWSGFCGDYDKVTYGMRHTLTLTRTTNDNNAIYKKDTVDAGKVHITKLSWMMPKVLPSDEMKYKLYKTIESKEVLNVGFRMHQCSVIQIPVVQSFSWRLGVKTAPEKPRWIIVGLQTNKSGNQDHNAALFDHCNVTNMCVVLNNVKYPLLDANANFNKYQFAHFYNSMIEFTRSYYGIDPMISTTSLSPDTYAQLTPIFVFDVTKQSERLDTGVVDMTIEMQFSQNVAANTTAHALVISDRRIKLQSDGKKMNVIF